MTDFETISSISYPTSSGIGSKLNLQKHEINLNKVAQSLLNKKTLPNVHASMRIYRNYRLKEQDSSLPSHDLNSQRKTSRSFQTLSNQFVSRSELSNRNLLPKSLQKQLVCQNSYLNKASFRVKTATSLPSEQQKKIYHKKLLKFPIIKNAAPVQEKSQKVIIIQNAITPLEINQISKMNLKPRPKLSSKPIISHQAKLANLKISMGKEANKFQDDNKPITGWSKDITEQETEEYLNSEIFSQL